MMDIAAKRPIAPHRTVLVVVGEPSIRDLIAANLRDAGFYPVGAGTASAARLLIGEVLPDAILIDLDGEPTESCEFAAGLRASAGDRQVPVLMLTSKARESAGRCCPPFAEEHCMAKPFHPQELVQRISRLFGASRRSAPGALRIGALQLDPSAHTVTAMRSDGARQIHLPTAQFRLLRYMMTHPDRVLRREQLMTGVWGSSPEVAARTVDQVVKRLRAGLQLAGLGDMVRTVRGVGYRLSAPGHE